MPKASVKIMLSYDYNHFEVCLSSDEEKTLTEIDAMRKDAQRLADKAVRQYQMAKEIERKKANADIGLDELRKTVRAIRENFPQSEWTEEQKAKVKLLDDKQYIMSSRYDYEDDDDDILF